MNENSVSVFVLSVSLSNFTAIDLDQRPLAPCTRFNGSIFASTPFDKNLPPLWNFRFEGVRVHEVHQVSAAEGKGLSVLAG